MPTYITDRVATPWRTINASSVSKQTFVGDKINANTIAAGPYTILLPTSGSGPNGAFVGQVDQVIIRDPRTDSVSVNRGWATNNLTISSANLIDGRSDIVISNLQGTTLTYAWWGGSVGWRQYVTLDPPPSAQPTRANDKEFLKFRNESENWIGNKVHENLNIWISKTNDLYVAGGGGFTNADPAGIGLGDQTHGVQNGFARINTPDDFAANEEIADIYASGYSMYMRSNLGNVWSCGYNGYGQLGLGNTTSTGNFTKTNILDVVWISPSNGNSQADHVFAVRANGQLYGAGYNGYGNLGNGTTTQANSWTRVDNFGQLAGKTVTKAWAVGDTWTSYCYSACTDSNRDLFVAGLNSFGQLGTGDRLQKNSWVQVIGPPGFKVDKLLMNCYNSYGATFALNQRTGQLYACGYGGNGQLGTGNTLDSNFFQLVTYTQNLSVLDIQSVNYYSSVVCALISDGSLRTWGLNSVGVLGTGDRVNRNTSVFAPPQFGPSNRAVKISAGGRYDTINFYVLDQFGRIWSSGYNGLGQRGQGTNTDINTIEYNTFLIMKPPYKGCKFINFSVWGNGGSGYADGYYHGVTAVDEYGTLWSCGPNDWGAAGYPGDNYYQVQYSRTSVFRRCVIT